MTQTQTEGDHQPFIRCVVQPKCLTSNKNRISIRFSIMSFMMNAHVIITPKINHHCLGFRVGSLNGWWPRLSLLSFLCFRLSLSAFPEGSEEFRIWWILSRILHRFSWKSKAACYNWTFCYLQTQTYCAWKTTLHMEDLCFRFKHVFVMLVNPSFEERAECFKAFGVHSFRYNLNWIWEVHHCS